MGSRSIDKGTRALHLSAIDEVTLEANGREVTVSGDDFKKAAQGEKPEQMTFTFLAPFSDIAIKEAVRGVKSLTREIIRLGGNERIVRSTLELLAMQNPIIYAAANAIEESLPD